MEEIFEEFPTKPNKRALRRHHRYRLLSTRKHYWHVGNPWQQGPEGRAHPSVANTPCKCSCPGCGNQRRLWGDTMQERRAEATLREELDNSE